MLVQWAPGTQRHTWEKSKEACMHGLHGPWEAFVITRRGEKRGGGRGSHHHTSCKGRISRRGSRCADATPFMDTKHSWKIVIIDVKYLLLESSPMLVLIIPPRPCCFSSSVILQASLCFTSSTNATSELLLKVGGHPMVHHWRCESREGRKGMAEAAAEGDKGEAQVAQVCPPGYGWEGGR